MDAEAELQEAKAHLAQRQDEFETRSAEVAQLREALQRERMESEVVTKDFEERLDRECREAMKLQAKLAQAQLAGRGTESEVSALRLQIEESTGEILRAMQEFREQQKAAFRQVKKLSHAMLKTCSQPSGSIVGGANGSAVASNDGGGHGSPVMGSAVSSVVGEALAGRSMPRIINGAGLASLSRSPPRSPASSVGFNAVAVTSPGGRCFSGVGLGSLSRSPPRSPSSSVVGWNPGAQTSPGGRSAGAMFRRPSPGGEAAAAAARPRSPSPDSEKVETEKWFQAMKANLEQFGDVEVFMHDAPEDCQCCLEHITTAYRVRPRKCGHIFHIECLLRCWTEGSCPVCHASFAPEQPADAAEDPKPEARRGGLGGGPKLVRGAGTGAFPFRSSSGPPV